MKEREHTIKRNAHKKESDLNKAISSLSKNLELDEASCSEKHAKLKKELCNIKQEEHQSTHHFIAAKDRLEGETVSKHYFQANKEAKPQDVI